MKSTKHYIYSSYLRNSRLFAAIIMLTVTAGSCTKFLDAGAPNDKLETNSVFADSISASSAITGVYSILMQGNTGFMSYKTALPGLNSDELELTSTTNALLEYNNNDIAITNTWVGNIWTELYTQIYRVNAIIESVGKSEGILPGAKAKLIAEAKFIRAFSYFYLVNYFGDVPLVTNTQYQVNATIARTASADVYRQMIEDLTDAKLNLYNDYPTGNRARPVRAAASALLSRVYLFTKDYINAEKEASAVISNSSFNLVSNTDLVFKKESVEIIWQLAPTRPNVYNTFDGLLFIPSAAYIPPFVFRDVFLNAFEGEDKRRASWIKGVTVNSATYYFPYKYKAYAGGTDEEYEIVFRLAEQYLIRAEARCQQNKITGANSAESDVNAIRERAGLENVTATDLPSMLTAIENERRLELFAEWGMRWLDLKRWPSAATPGKTRADDILSILKGSNWQSTDIYWPIPAAQILLNGNLKQNDGYKK